MTRLAPPTGHHPPDQVRLRTGEVIVLAPLAVQASEQHLASHPEELEQHGPHARDWCAHDLQWLLLWAIMAADDQGVDFDAQLDWLARVLAARNYPLGSLADAVNTLAEEIAPVLPAPADTLRAGAARVRP
jgi:hypothetical protein